MEKEREKKEERKKKEEEMMVVEERKNSGEELSFAEVDRLSWILQPALVDY